MAKAANKPKRSDPPPQPRKWPAIARGPIPLMVLTAVLLLPFVGKAFHIDDTLFVCAAQQIRIDPLHPYAMEFNWVDVPDTFWRATQNPPLDSYIIAGVSLGTGMLEWPIHLVFILIAVGCTWLMYLIAQRFCARPTLATAATIATPAFVVTATSVMADIPLLFFWLLSVWLALRFVETKRAGLDLGLRPGCFGRGDDEVLRRRHRPVAAGVFVAASARSSTAFVRIVVAGCGVGGVGRLCRKGKRNLSSAQRNLLFGRREGDDWERLWANAWLYGSRFWGAECCGRRRSCRCCLSTRESRVGGFCNSPRWLRLSA